MITKVATSLTTKTIGILILEKNYDKIERVKEGNFMSFSAMNVYEDQVLPCAFCGEQIEEGPVVELLTTDIHRLSKNEALNHDEDDEGRLATNLDYTDCTLAHLACVDRAVRHALRAKTFEPSTRY